MTIEINHIPDWDNSDNWQEIEWEHALKYSDDLASRYFVMLERFDDLPNAEELIAAKLGEQNFFQLEECGYDDDWDNEISDFNTFDDHEDNDLLGFDDKVTRGDSLYFETCPVYSRARQITLGWCNIVSSVLKPEDRFWGISILFNLGRLLSYLSLSIGDGTFEHLNGSVIFAKRSLQQINFVLGEIRSKTEESPNYKSMFGIVKTHLLENHDLVIDYILDCRQRQKDDKTAE